MQIYAIESITACLAFCRVKLSESGSLILIGKDKTKIRPHNMDVGAINKIESGDRLAVMFDFSDANLILAIARLDFTEEKIEPLWHESPYWESFFHNRFMDDCEKYFREERQPRKF